MRLRLLLLATILGVAVVGARAQSPFDMSGEDGGAPPDVASPAAPAAASPPPIFAPPLQLGEPAAPSGSSAGAGVPMTVPSLAPSGAPRVVAPAATGVPVVPPRPAAEAPAAETPANTAAAQPTASGRVRYIVPQPTLRLEGEMDLRAWTIFLTPGEAASAAKISVSYKNAIVVMPEASRLRILVNGLVALETPIASSDDYKSVTADIPANTLQPGANLVRFEVVQRHRTDCSIQSTYELWTDIDTAGTMLTFEGDDTSMAPATLEDLPAVGYDATGRTTLHIITPRANEPAIAPLLIKLTQAIALYGQYPNPSVVVTDREDGQDGPGTLTLLLAPAAELASITDHPPAPATQPLVSFLATDHRGPSALAVTGADWGQIQAAVDAVASRIDRPLDVKRTVLSTSYWFAPNVHFFTGPESVSLGEMGVATQQFSGRRFRVEFGVGIPSDFYAQAYGEATLLLDAAYTPAVLPASHIDVYVNGQIATTTRIVSKSGGIFRHFPINVPFRNFHPGVNRITLEAVLDTAADQACAPGGSVAGPDRFVLFDTSEFSMPNFARIWRRPDLSAFAATGAPYNRQTEPSALVMPRTNPEAVAAASTLMARLAIQAARIVKINVVSMANVGDRPAIFVGSAPQLPPDLLRRLGIADSIRTNWKADSKIGSGQPDATLPLADAQADRQSTDVLFDQWRDKLSDGGGWRGQVSGLEDWMKRTFDISFSELRLGPPIAVAFEPRPKASVLLAQGSSPSGTDAWTLLTAPTDEQLASVTRQLVSVANWSKVEGEFSTFSTSTGTIENEMPKSVTFVPSQPLSLQNARLVAANWLSNNITFYAITLIAACLILGVVTSFLLHRLGRPS